MRGVIFLIYITLKTSFYDISHTSSYKICKIITAKAVIKFNGDLYEAYVFYKGKYMR